MIIPIDHETRITSDRHHWILQRARRRRRNGEWLNDWRSESYYPSLPLALIAVGEAWVRCSDAEGLSNAILEYQNAATRLAEALLPVATDGAQELD
jgi:hypothetical protein